MNLQLKDRLLSRLDLNGPLPDQSNSFYRGLGKCWQFKGVPQSSGYGSISFQGKSIYAHRASWLCFFGEIRIGLCVLHKCDNRLCSNPEHLFLGTIADNQKDMSMKGRTSRKSSCVPLERRARGDRSGSRLHPERRPKGERHAFAKLDNEKVLECRRAFSSGELTIMQLAAKHEVAFSTMRQVVLRETWKHI